MDDSHHFDFADLWCSHRADERIIIHFALHLYALLIQVGRCDHLVDPKAADRQGSTRDTMKQAILGISAYYHDSAAAVLIDGEIAAAAQEERFSRIKYDASFPMNAIRFVLDEAGVKEGDLLAVAFYDKPYLKFERLLETYHAFAPKGLASWLAAVPIWIKEKLFMKKLVRDHLAELGVGKHVPLYFPEHHLSHAASAFYPSPFEEAAILTIDGVGEWATTTIGRGESNRLEIIRELHFPHSLGLLYSAFTYYAGFKVNSGEYKLMGLAPYGNVGSPRFTEYKDKIVSELVDIREDGSVLLNMDYFRYATGLRMVCEPKWEKLFGVPRRIPESEISPAYADMALAVQRVSEEIILRLAKTARQVTGSRHLVMAGGVALNSVANGMIVREKWFDDIWIQPAAGDAGGALGAAYAAWHIKEGRERSAPHTPDGMRGAYLGPKVTEEEVERLIRREDAKARHFEDSHELTREIAQMLAEGKIVGWVQGRMEFGPRALGNRSILGDPRNPETQKKLNLEVKLREEFRPFAPSVLVEDVAEYFDLDRPSPYMLFVVPVCEGRRIPLSAGVDVRPLQERLYCPRSALPAITHVDYSARVQTVNREINPRFWQLIHQFKELTGFGVLVNTSFNLRGEPMVRTAAEAYRCFMRTAMDALVIGDYLFPKPSAPPPH